MSSKISIQYNMLGEFWSLQIQNMSYLHLHGTVNDTSRDSAEPRATEEYVQYYLRVVLYLVLSVLVVLASL